jgi:predicted ATP-dependent serine protease
LSVGLDETGWRCYWPFCTCAGDGWPVWTNVFVNAVGGVRIHQARGRLGCHAGHHVNLRGRALLKELHLGEVGLAGKCARPARAAERLKETAKLGNVAVVLSQCAKKTHHQRA